MFTDQRLFRARGFEPVAAIGDVVYLLDQAGPMSRGPFHFVKAIEPILGPAPHDYLILYNQGGLNAAPAGYGLKPGSVTTIPEVLTGNLVHNTSGQVNNPAILQQGKSQMLQMRFNLAMTALTGPKEHDIELQMFLPAAVARFSLPGAGVAGYINKASQMQQGADAIDEPAVGANMTLPAAFPANDPFDVANMREIFIFEDKGPLFVIWNNHNATDLTAGTIGIQLRGFRYDLELMVEDSDWVPRWVYGRIQNAPPSDARIPVIPTAAFLTTQIR